MIDKELDRRIITYVLKREAHYDDIQGCYQIMIVGGRWRAFAPSSIVSDAIQLVRWLKRELRCDFELVPWIRKDNSQMYDAIFQLPHTRFKATACSANQQKAICEAALLFVEQIDEKVA